MISAELTSFIQDVPLDLQNDWALLTDREKELVLLAIRDSKIGDALLELDFKVIPVSPREFLSDPYYIGEDLIWDEREETGLYPHWKEELCYVLENDVLEWILSGSLGGGKTSCAIIAILYKIYLLSCLRSPHGYLGLAPTVPIDYILFNINLKASTDTGLSRFKTIMISSPYFREVFPHGNKIRRKGFGGTDLMDYKLELPPFLRVLEASRDTHAISRDVLGGMLDEVNFVIQAKGTGQLNYDSTSKAFSLYQGLQNRISNRFMRDGKIFGSIVCLCSSAATQFDFLEQHKKQKKTEIEDSIAKGEKPRVHISEFAIYDIIPWRFKGPRFPILIGTDQSNSRIISEDEAIIQRSLGQQVIEVPEVSRSRYEADLPRALKEISGIPSEIVSPLFPMREQVKRTISVDENGNENRIHPFTVESPQIGHRSGPSLESLLIPEELAVWSGGSLSPRHYPKSARVMHIDLSKNQCATGISMGCVSGYKEVPSYSWPDLNSQTTTIAPLVWVDFTLRIAPPPPPEEIGYEKIHAFINYLRHHLGFNLAMISFDGYQSLMMSQILENENYNVSLLSVDKTPDPYFALKGAVIEERLVRYKYPPLERELYGLRLLSEGNKTWIEKPSGGEKDVADTLACLVHHCTEMTRDSYSPPIALPTQTFTAPFIRA